jgi:hypothetical protein
MGLSCGVTQNKTLKDARIVARFVVKKDENMHLTF